MSARFPEYFEYIKEDLFDSPLFYKGERDEELIEDVKNSKIVIYTAFTGDYDSLKDPEFIDDNCDYVCFTDNPNVKSDIWKIIPIKDCNLDNNRIAKQFKVLPHKFFPEYKYSFWMDGTFKIKKSIREYIYKYLKNPMLNVSHDERNCAYDEFITSAAKTRYPTAILKKQIEKYEKEGLPRHYGLPSAGVIFREHNNPQIIKLMEDWWDEIIKFTNQDQISFTYVCWKNDFHPAVSDVFCWNNEYWAQKSLKRHKQDVNTPVSSLNLIHAINSNKTQAKDLTPSEIQLLYNDVITLEYEMQCPDEYLASRIIVYQNGEKYTLTKHYQNKNENTIRFDLKFFENIEKITFSPDIHLYTICSIKSLKSDADMEIVRSSSRNEASEEMQLFGNKTPRYTIEGDFTNASFIEITFTIKIINEYEFNLENEILKDKKVIKKRDQTIAKRDESIKRRDEKIEQKNNDIKYLQGIIEEMSNSTSWKITKPLRSVTNKIKK